MGLGKGKEGGEREGGVICLFLKVGPTSSKIIFIKSPGAF